QEVALGFLGRQDVERYVALAFPGHDFPADFPALLHAQTEGNPLFLVDLLRYLRDRRVIAKPQGRWALARRVPDVRRELPESLGDLIERKIGQLEEADRRLLMAASVQGHAFDSAVAAQVLGAEAAQVEERLEALERVHALVQLAGEEELPDRT